MGVLVLIEGSPGTGKSRSIIGLDPQKTAVIKPNSKDLPFRGSRKMYNEKEKNVFYVDSFHDVSLLIKKINEGKRFNNIVVDDFTHLFGKRVLRDTAISGFKKWNELAIDAFEAMLGMEKELRDDLFLFFMVHTVDIIDSDGKKETVMQTPGKLLDNLVKLPSYFTFILHTDISEDNGEILYRFQTNKTTNGKEAKSPEGCFDIFIENDLGLVRSKIQEFLGI